jgi:BCCT family betaine/carnitine transporter
MDAPRFQRMFWATLQGLIAACLLVGGGSDALGAIQAVAVTVGLPFTVIMIVMMVSLYLGLQGDYKNYKF